MTHDSSFVDLLGRTARADPDRVFARFDGAPMTFGALHRRSDALASSLRRLGVEPGARVAVMLRNSPAALDHAVRARQGGRRVGAGQRAPPR